ncbi:MAG TPA: AAA family ATPase [Nitrosomonas europaea]|uniref:AAA family ATPase n=1 Tax=Nitrosomonas europaea TaxID=915 RepID=UPI002CD38828|nr:AAA family ATPase [Nitrosomonas europaea]HRO56440.1 AAA family ATPase [Nitrosomonas europaea]HUM74487.1 AAA family ATPase [Nitrosomonas europaea]
MIESITIQGAPSFGQEAQAIDGLSQFNFLFGSNGAGKTTVSRIIADESAFPSCAVNWKGATKLESLVYNHDFVERNFRQVAELRGVFTLGEQQQDTLDKIAAAKAEVDNLTKKAESLTHTLQGIDSKGGKRGELIVLETAFEEKAWTYKQKFEGNNIQSAFKGFMGSKDSFKTKVLQEQESNTSAVLSQADLEKKAASIFGQTPTTEPTVPVVDAASLLSHESNPILKKRVIGKEDVDIAAMIKKLGNSDWVRAGRSFYDVNDQICPFCQQETDEAFTKSLNDYFDETFIADSNAIDALAINYTTDSDRIRQQLSGIIASPSKFLDVEKLKSEKELLDAKLNINIQRIGDKKKEASQVVELESISNVVSKIKSLIDAANLKVTEHNKIVSNLDAERKILTGQIWRFVLEELKAELAAYKASKNGLNNAIASIERQIKDAEAAKKQKQAEIRELEKQTTSVQPTIDAINALLSSFGFQSFKLAKSQTGTSYKLLRQDGSDAKSTLSEGEKTFVTFLYFYHLLKGSTSESGMTANRIIVFDDPVSSLDSEVLFIVSSLIKGIFDEVRAGTGYIKQVFVLTHNVYFHKEITYNQKRKEKALKEETFWVLRKMDLFSKLDKHDSNPIRTSYDLLWTEVRRTDRSNLTIQNTLRRILENYFKILGGIDLNQLSEKFDGKERLICKSLVSWVNDGSHFAHDDLYVSLDDAQVDTYLKVFEEIFRKSDHHTHYRMMMGDAFIEKVVEALPGEARQ